MHEDPQFDRGGRPRRSPNCGCRWRHSQAPAGNRDVTFREAALLGYFQLLSFDLLYVITVGNVEEEVHSIKKIPRKEPGRITNRI